MRPNEAWGEPSTGLFECIDATVCETRVEAHLEALWEAMSKADMPCPVYDPYPGEGVVHLVDSEDPAGTWEAYCGARPRSDDGWVDWAGNEPEPDRCHICYAQVRTAPEQPRQSQPPN